MLDEPSHELHRPLIKHLPVKLLDQDQDLFNVKEEGLGVAEELLFLLLQLDCSGLDNALLQLLSDLDVVGLTDVGPCIFKGLVVGVNELVLFQGKGIFD
jgi:hypothetical protein